MNNIVKPTLEQQRAAFAWRRVSERSGKPEFQDYRNLAKSAPALVAANGLLTSLLFFASKGGKGHYEWLLEDLAHWLAERSLPPGRRAPDAGTLREVLTQASPSEYREATEEVLQVLRWIRQFAAAAGSGGNASQRP